MHYMRQGRGSVQVFHDWETLPVGVSGETLRLGRTRFRYQREPLGVNYHDMIAYSMIGI